MGFPIFDLMDRLESWDGSSEMPTISTETDGSRLVLRLNVGHADPSRLGELEAMFQEWCGGGATTRPDIDRGRLTLVCEIRRPRRTKTPQDIIRPIESFPLTDNHRLLLSILEKADAPLSAREISRRSGLPYKNRSQFGQALSDLRLRACLVLRVETLGEKPLYWLKSRPLPVR